jgi:hypothetical protein
VIARKMEAMKAAPSVSVASPAANAKLNPLTAA